MIVVVLPLRNCLLLTVASFVNPTVCPLVPTAAMQFNRDPSISNCGIFHLIVVLLQSLPFISCCRHSVWLLHNELQGLPDVIILSGIIPRGMLGMLQTLYVANLMNGDNGIHPVTQVLALFFLFLAATHHRCKKEQEMSSRHIIFFLPWLQRKKHTTRET